MTASPPRPPAPLSSTCALPSALVHPSGDLVYIPDVFTTEEEATFLSRLYEPSRDVKWVTLRHRRLVNLGGFPDPKGMLPQPIPQWGTEAFLREDRMQAVAAALDDTAWGEKTRRSDVVSSSSSSCCCLLPKPINHVLINEYSPPHGIMGHEDGPLYYPTVVIVSLESTVPLVFHRKPHLDATTTAAEKESSEVPTKDDEKHSGLPECLVIALQPRSLVAFRGSLYTDYLHEVPDGDVDVYEASTCFNFSLLHRASLALAGKEGTIQSEIDDNESASGLQTAEPDPTAITVPRTARRISVTYRHVLRVFKVDLTKFGHKR